MYGETVDTLALIYTCTHTHTHTHTQPTLDRQEVRTVEDEVPEYGEGSEFGRKRREEARKKKRGIRIRKPQPDDQPWILREQKKGGKQSVFPAYFLIALIDISPLFF